VDLSFADAIETPSRFSYPIGRLDRLCWQSDQSPPEGHDAVVPVRRPGRAPSGSWGCTRLAKLSTGGTPSTRWDARRARGHCPR